MKRPLENKTNASSKRRKTLQDVRHVHRYPTKGNRKNIFFDIDFFLNDTFRLIGVKILSNLDEQSLLNCKQVSKRWWNFIENERFFWHREIDFYKGKCQELKMEDLLGVLHQLVTRETSIRHLKSVALAVRKLPINEDIASVVRAYLELLLKMKPEELIALMIEEELSVQVQDDLKQLQIDAAMKLKHLGLFKKLAHHSQVINWKTFGGTLFYYCSDDIKDYMLEHEKCCGIEELFTFKDDLGRSSVHYFAAYRSLKYFKLAASRLEDINLRDNDGNNPLYYLAYYLPPNNPGIKVTLQLIDTFFRHAKGKLIQKNNLGEDPIDVAKRLNCMYAARRMSTLWARLHGERTQ